MSLTRDTAEKDWLDSKLDTIFAEGRKGGTKRNATDPWTARTPLMRGSECIKSRSQQDPSHLQEDLRLPVNDLLNLSSFSLGDKWRVALLFELAPV